LKSTAVYTRHLKPIFDRLAASLLLLATAVVTVPVAIVLALTNGGKVFFIQQRPGQYGTPFYLIKFRTMTDAHDAAGDLLPDSQRLTPLGSLLRLTSLDELPQLINVLKGQMSLVGPRPLLMEYLPLYNRQQAVRHRVKPGITGWAQVNGRNAVAWSQRFAYDRWYVENQSFRLDLQILLLTLGKVVRAEGIRAEQSLTMKKFTGEQI
jgi:lipopolysaccharide/colanic/teichoic acid biosynthesis glycosyltransferase